MRFVDEFRDPAAARALVKSITELAGTDEFKFMEVCGGHTHTIYRHGIEHLLPEAVELVHGPGCPVCVIPMGRVDDAMWLAEQPGVIFTTFGDMMRVPGSKGNLIEAKARGADVRFVYSPLDALKVALDNPDRACRLLRGRIRDDGAVNRGHPGSGARARCPQLQRVLQPRHDRPADQGHPRVARPAALGVPRARPRVHGGGLRPYRFVPEVYGKPMVVAGFEPLDILASVHMLLQQIREGRCEVENQYTRVVRPEGNTQALKLMAETFELRPHFEWRGLGFISQSALKVHPDYAEFDAERKFDDARRAGRRPQGMPMRGGAQGRHQAVGVQGVRHGVHTRNADRHVHGVPGGRLRGLLQLRQAASRNRTAAGPARLAAAVHHWSRGTSKSAHNARQTSRGSTPSSMA